jgi:1-acyl-sn-glycerol-3-phosphate acyltransferase
MNPAAMLRRVAGGLAAPPWTMLVTVASIGVAKLTGEERWVRRGEKLWARGLLGAWGVRVTVVDRYDLDPSQPIVVMANHSSHIDVPLLFMSLGVVPGFIAKKELERVPFVAMALRAGGHVLLDRADRQSAMRALKLASDHVREGRTIAVFPEGTRGNGQVLGEFKKGGFLIAKRAAAAILPVGIRGSRAVLHPGSVLPTGGSVSVHVGRLITPDVVRSLPLNALCERVAAEVSSLSAVPTDSRRTRPECGEPTGVAQSFSQTMSSR